MFKSDDCSCCFHKKVCKLCETMEKEKARIHEAMDGVPIVYGKIEIKCDDFVSVQDIILRSEHQYLNAIPTVRPPYEITCTNANVDTKNN